MAGLESSGASSGPCSPQSQTHESCHDHLDETHPRSSVSVSPPSTSSECGSGTSSRRPSFPDHVKDESYREKRKRNNDAARRSREKRRMNDLAMEQRLIELTKENSLLKSKLNSLSVNPSTPTPSVSAHKTPTVIEPPRSSTGFPDFHQRPSSSVIVAGPSVVAPPVVPPPPGPSGYFGSQFPSASDPLSAGLPDLYPLDLSQAAMAAAAASALKLPLTTNSFFSPHLLAAAAAAASAPLLAPVMPTGVDSFNMLPLGLRPFGTPSLSTAQGSGAPFNSRNSAFQPFCSTAGAVGQHRPSVVEMAPAPPKPSATLEPRPTSVIHSAPVVNGRSVMLDPPRPSVVQPPSSLDFSKGLVGLGPLATSSALGNQVQFISQLPLAQEPRPSVFAKTTNDILSASLTTRTVPAPPVASSRENQPSLLGSLLAANRHSPTVLQSRTEQQSGLASEKSEAANDLKANLTTLAVQLHTTSSSSAASSSSSLHGTKSDSDSLGSPQSTRSSNADDHGAHGMPDGEGPGGDDKPGGGPKRSTPDLERYRDRRRRNNEAAKRCRANRRAAFEYRSKRSQQLEMENGELRQEMLKLSNELEQLKAIIAANNRLLPTQ